MHGLLFDVAGISAQGPRPENQDAFSVDAFAGTGLVAVADGMGGERAGRMAADTALRAVAEQAPIQSLDAARYAVRAADEAVARAALEAPDDRHGMGCALAIASLTRDRSHGLGWVCANAGDVRVLSRSPDGTVRLETRDHTPAFARWEAGEIALDEIPDSPGANKLQRAVGRGAEADASWVPVRPGWTYLLVSDGITKAMRLDELGQAMMVGDAATACEAIARKVEERGPDDNYTAVAVRVLADGAAADDTDDSLTQESPRRPAAAPLAARPAASGPLNPPEPVTRSRTSPLAPIALLLALAAVALAGYSLMTALAARDSARSGTAGVADLRSRVAAVEASLVTPDTAAADSARPAAGAPTPPAQTAPAPAANRTSPR
ncbi:MAG TPA: protein phosphatase 2C domain-containing protein [Longimicrobium sp.]